MAGGGSIYELRSWMYLHKDSDGRVTNAFLSELETFMHQAGFTPITQESEVKFPDGYVSNLSRCVERGQAAGLMAPRRKPAAPTYAQLFGDGSGTSSSGPSSSDAFEKTIVLPSLSDLFKMTHATSDRVFVDHASEKLFQAVAARIEERNTQLTEESPDGLPVTLSTEDADRIFEEVAPKKKGRIVGIGSVNEVARATSSYASRRDEGSAQMKAQMDNQKAQMDSQQVRLDSLKDLLDVMAVGNPVIQRRRVRSNPSTAEQPHQLLPGYIMSDLEISDDFGAFLEIFGASTRDDHRSILRNKYRSMFTSEHQSIAKRAKSPFGHS
uniref:Uncharacterized protein n=1 Tax=Brassica oleracea var. oleracea TaxID=109376 RepID=A0A0D3E6Z1_BRAOL